MEDQLTAQTMKLNESAPPGFLASGKSLINEVEKLREAVLLLCELQKELAKKLDEALDNPITKEAAVPCNRIIGLPILKEPDNQLNHEENTQSEMLQLSQMSVVSFSLLLRIASRPLRRFLAANGSGSCQSGQFDCPA